MRKRKTTAHLGDFHVGPERHRATFRDGVIVLRRYRSRKTPPHQITLPEIYALISQQALISMVRQSAK